MPQTGKKSRPVEPSQQGTGLKMTAHPLLLDTTPTALQSQRDLYKPMQPKFVSVKVSCLFIPFHLSAHAEPTPCILGKHPKRSNIPRIFFF